MISMIVIHRLGSKIGEGRRSANAILKGRSACAARIMSRADDHISEIWGWQQKFSWVSNILVSGDRPLFLRMLMCRTSISNCWYPREVTSRFVAVLGTAQIEQVIPHIVKYTATANIEKTKPRIWPFFANTLGVCLYKLYDNTTPPVVTDVTGATGVTRFHSRSSQGYGPTTALLLEMASF